MRVKLACACLFGTFLLFVTSGSANMHQRAGAVPLRPSLIERAADRIAALPGAAESFFHELGAPALRNDPDTPDTIDAPKDATPTPLARARAALADSNAPALPRDELCSNLVDVAQANALPLGFFTNLIWRESRFDHEAISPVGAMGIAQFMPDVADKFDINAFDGREALPASGKLLRTLADRFGNLGLAAAAYNAGPKRVADWLAQRAGLPKETRDYVSLITGKPVEEWRGVKEKAVVFSVPRAVPCHRATHFAAIEQSERIAQQERVAEERRAIERAREAARRAAEALKRASAKHKTKDKKEPRVITATGKRSQHVAKL
ncbi:MAG: lytic transglycosylase domain-containing protein [Alphaproteobacteria bacterium]